MDDMNLDLDPALVDEAVAVAERRNLAILTTDRDFMHFATILPIALHVRIAG